MSKCKMLKFKPRVISTLFMEGPSAVTSQAAEFGLATTKCFQNLVDRSVNTEWCGHSILRLRGLEILLTPPPGLPRLVVLLLLLVDVFTASSHEENIQALSFSQETSQKRYPNDTILKCRNRHRFGVVLESNVESSSFREPSFNVDFNII